MSYADQILEAREKWALALKKLGELRHLAQVAQGAADHAELEERDAHRAMLKLLHDGLEGVDPRPFP